MENSNPADNKILNPFIAIAAATLLFFAVLLIPVPTLISRAVSEYSLPLFLLVLVTYYFGFRLGGIYAGLVPACITMLLLGVSMSFLWHSGYSDDKIIGGLLPFRDGFDYYIGASRILNARFIKIIDEGAAWRPLYPGFLSALLWLTVWNLQRALAIQVGIAGLCLALSARYVRKRLGAAAAALYVTMLYFYIQPLIGTAYTESLGLTLGSLGLVLLWEAAETRRSLHLILGLATLMIAVSARAGAFFIFPALIVWAGWAFRGQQRFSLRDVGIALGTVVMSYLIVNTLYGRLIVEPGGSPFGNFAFTIYGQVTGGAGYHKAFEDLGVRNPALILRAAESFFLTHPLSFGLGAVKAYRDFFSPESGVFSFGSGVENVLVWLAGLPLLLLGVHRSVRRIGSPASSLLLAGFAGILLSIPFLPPIDGGIRIYASTMPCIYALAAAPLAGLFEANHAGGTETSVAASAGVAAMILALLTVVAPVVIRYATRLVISWPITCPAGQPGFVVVVSRGSFIDLVPDGLAECGSLPGVCLSRFKKYSSSNDPSDAAVYDQLAAAAGQSVIRVFPGIELIDGRPHLFVGSPQQLDVPNNVVVVGCATETLIKGRPSIYAIQSISGVGIRPLR